jgi:hypothetical protein
MARCLQLRLFLGGSTVYTKVLSWTATTSLQQYVAKSALD